jgi:hypothetical protein
VSGILIGILLSTFRVATVLDRQNKNTGSFAYRYRSSESLGTCLGPLATYFTWLQAGRPNHHETPALFTPVMPANQRKNMWQRSA